MEDSSLQQHRCVGGSAEAEADSGRDQTAERSVRPGCSGQLRQRGTSQTRQYQQRDNGATMEEEEEEEEEEQPDLSGLELKGVIFHRFKDQEVEGRYLLSLHASCRGTDFWFMLMTLISSTVMLIKLAQDETLDSNHLWEWKWHHLKDKNISVCLPWVVIRFLWCMLGTLVVATPPWALWYVRNRYWISTSWDMGIMLIELFYSYAHDDIFVFAWIRQLAIPFLGMLGRHGTPHQLWPQRVWAAGVTLASASARKVPGNFTLVVLLAFSYVLSNLGTWAIDWRMREVHARRQRQLRRVQGAALAHIRAGIAARQLDEGEGGEQGGGLLVGEGHSSERAPPGRRLSGGLVGDVADVDADVADAAAASKASESEKAEAREEWEARLKREAAGLPPESRPVPEGGTSPSASCPASPPAGGGAAGDERLLLHQRGGASKAAQARAEVAVGCAAVEDAEEEEEVERDPMLPVLATITLAAADAAAHGSCRPHVGGSGPRSASGEGSTPGSRAGDDEGAKEGSTRSGPAPAQGAAAPQGGHGHARGAPSPGGLLRGEGRRRSKGGEGGETSVSREEVGGAPASAWKELAAPPSSSSSAFALDSHGADTSGSEMQDRARPRTAAAIGAAAAAAEPRLAQVGDGGKAQGWGLFDALEEDEEEPASLDFDMFRGARLLGLSSSTSSGGSGDSSSSSNYFSSGGRGATAGGALAGSAGVNGEAAPQGLLQEEEEEEEEVRGWAAAVAARTSSEERAAACLAPSNRSNQRTRAAISNLLAGGGARAGAGAGASKEEIKYLLGILGGAASAGQIEELSGPTGERQHASSAATGDAKVGGRNGGENGGGGPLSGTEQLQLTQEAVALLRARMAAPRGSYGGFGGGAKTARRRRVKG